MNPIVVQDDAFMVPIVPSKNRKHHTFL